MLSREVRLRKFLGFAGHTPKTSERITIATYVSTNRNRSWLELATVARACSRTSSSNHGYTRPPLPTQRPEEISTASAGPTTKPDTSLKTASRGPRIHTRRSNSWEPPDFGRARGPWNPHRKAKNRTTRVGARTIGSARRRRGGGGGGGQHDHHAVSLRPFRGSSTNGVVPRWRVVSPTTAWDESSGLRSMTTTTARAVGRITPAIDRGVGTVVGQPPTVSSP